MNEIITSEVIITAIILCFVLIYYFSIKDYYKYYTASYYISAGYTTILDETELSSEGKEYVNCTGLETYKIKINHRKQTIYLYRRK